jgi:N-acetylmuramoyl-L-alanine amidase/FlgD Ig-like domain
VCFGTVRSLKLALLAFLLVPATAHAGEATLVTRELPVQSGRTLAAGQSAERFNLVGLHWQGPGRVSFRTRSLQGRWSSWRDAAPEAEDAPDRNTAERARRATWKLGNPYWTGPANRIQYRLRGRVTRLRAHYVWSPADAVPARALTATTAPAIVTRFAWRASESIRRGAPRYASSLRFAVVHHSAGSNSYTKAQSAAVVRAIQLYHVRGNGWDDVGYNFLVDKYGQVFEGRFGGIERNVIGAHAQGFNTGSVGVALLGNYNSATLTAAARSALVRLLAWRLDVAHVDPLTLLSMPSGGNPRFPTGIPVLLRPVSGHRDVGFTSCPGSTLYSQLSQLARAVSLTGLPKLYAPAAAATAGRVRFTGRLSAPIPWTVHVTDSFGAQVATGGGFGSRVDWTWDSRVAAPGRYTWAIRAGPTLRPATGSVVAGSGSTLLLSAVAAQPATVSPNGDGYADATTIRYTLGTPATVTATVLDGDGVALATLFSEAKPAGAQAFRWLADALPDGGYSVLIAAKTLDGREVASSVPVSVNRTLGSVSSTPKFLSPNGDGRADSLRVAFTLAADADVVVTVRSGATVTATIFAGRLPVGPRAVDWDGKIAGVPLPDGTYEAVVEATTLSGTAAQPARLVVDTTAPVLRLVSAFKRLATLSEAATVTTVVDGNIRTFVRRKAGLFRIPAPSSYRNARVAARDPAGNIARQLIVRRKPTRRTAARVARAAPPAARRG